MAFVLILPNNALLAKDFDCLFFAKIDARLPGGGSSLTRHVHETSVCRHAVYIDSKPGYVLSIALSRAFNHPAE